MESLTLKSMPVGYRFHPTDEELINHYLGGKNNGDDKDVSAICEVDVCKWEPWDLPGLSVIKSNDNEWFFFCPKDKYENGKRSKRATAAGYWKATGRERMIKTSNRTKVIGNKRTLVFYKGRARKSVKTHWVIHEYCATYKGAFLLWKLFKKHDGKPDENSEPPNCDKIDDSSPAVVEYSAENAQSEQITNQPDIRPLSVESFQAENYERAITDPLSPIGLHNNSCTFDDAEHQSLDSISIQPEIFSPLDSQMQYELGCGNHNNGLDELLLQDDINEIDINELLNLVDFNQPLSDNAEFCCAPMAPQPTMMTDIYSQESLGLA